MNEQPTQNPNEGLAKGPSGKILLTAGAMLVVFLSVWFLSPVFVNESGVSDTSAFDISECYDHVAPCEKRLSEMHPIGSPLWKFRETMSASGMRMGWDRATLSDSEYKGDFARRLSRKYSDMCCATSYDKTFAVGGVQIGKLNIGGRPAMGSVHGIFDENDKMLGIKVHFAGTNWDRKGERKLRVDGEERLIKVEEYYHTPEHGGPLDLQRLLDKRHPVGSDLAAFRHTMEQSGMSLILENDTPYESPLARVMKKNIPACVARRNIDALFEFPLRVVCLVTR